MISVRDALNTRFDLLQNGLNQACGANGDLCLPSLNSRKDLVRDGTGGNSCGVAAGGQGWKLPANAYPILASTTTPRELTDAEINTPVAPMGYPRDICHAFSITGSCTGGLIGNGNWDRLAYFRSRPTEWPEAAGFTRTTYNAFETWMSTKFGSTAPTRYKVYATEMADAANRLKSQNVGGMMSHGQPVCNGPGINPVTDPPDRRVLSVAVLNCDAEDVSASSTSVTVTSWIDIFLVEPVLARNDRTENGDVYVEIIGETENSGNTLQVVQKAVPYLIE
jgi:hypothetical protein